jgi:hypothetical protein
VRKILRIVRRTTSLSRGGEPYIRTYAVVEGGDEVYGYGPDFAVGDEVMVFFHDKYNAAKMRKP